MDRSQRMIRLLVPFLVLAIAGCASTPPPEPAPTPMATPAPAMTPAPSSTAMMGDPDMATVYIYRPKSFVGMALQPTVMLDGQDLLDARNGTVWKGMFKPGRYNFQMDDKKSGAELDLKAGESYFMRVDIVAGVWKGGGRMTQVTADQGMKDTAKLNPLPAGEVKHAMFKGM
jgi:hypothetical protein